MTAWISVLYGVIQGVTEFLPVSSSGHLALLPHVVSMKDPGVVFDLFMHLGTALAICIYFRSQVIKLVKESLYIIMSRDLKRYTFTVNFIAATLVSVVFILLLKVMAEQFGRSPSLIAFNLILFGGLMIVADRSDESASGMKSSGQLKSAMLIGLSQALAIFPGVSRSGVTLSMARLLKIEREEAGKFSFLLSLPIIFASVLYKLPETLNSTTLNFSMSSLLIGTVVSFVCGILTIHFFLKMIKSIGLMPFALYRFILGAIILFWF